MSFVMSHVFFLQHCSGSMTLAWLEAESFLIEHFLDLGKCSFFVVPLTHVFPLDVSSVAKQRCASRLKHGSLHGMNVPNRCLSFLASWFKHGNPCVDC